ncbi:MAG: sugar phosphate nucleotidyltransferase [Actinomycetota bacterium]|nr:sugar phosphate nucleotidyltransferase [Actinomycetota bacterium]
MASPDKGGPDSPAAVVLAAGSGTRLRPLTAVLPKALCPVANVALVDRAVARARAVTAAVAVNVHHGRARMEAHLEGAGVHVAVEDTVALGTAGALGNLRPWIAGRPVLVVNADAWHRADLAAFTASWDGERPRLLTVTDRRLATWGDRAYAGAALLPWTQVRRFSPTPSGLWEVSWRYLRPGVDLELVHHDGPFLDCGTPGSYLAANLAESGGCPVIGEGAVVDGDLDRSVVWPGARVVAGERLRCAVRAADRVTVLVR